MDDTIENRLALSDAITCIRNEIFGPRATLTKIAPDVDHYPHIKCIGDLDNGLSRLYRVSISSDNWRDIRVPKLKNSLAEAQYVYEYYLKHII